jgi:hypothetical protein
MQFPSKLKVPRDDKPSGNDFMLRATRITVIPETMSKALTTFINSL